MPLLKTHTISRAHLEALTERPISDVISPLELKPALATPPFVQNCPLLNVRDLGLVPDSGIRPGLVYRCGMMSDDVETATWLQNNVKAIFDLRHAAEAARMPDPQPEGVQYVRLETVGKFDRLNLEEFGEGDGSAAWKKRYLEILELYAPTIQAVLAHLRDAGTPFVIHCGGE